jgi:PleD family two-component response regulator
MGYPLNSPRDERYSLSESAGKKLHPQTNPPYRVLVVEDNIGIRSINAEVLQQSGYLVDTAEDA